MDDTKFFTGRFIRGKSYPNALNADERLKVFKEWKSKLTINDIPKDGKEHTIRIDHDNGLQKCFIDGKRFS